MKWGALLVFLLATVLWAQQPVRIQDSSSATQGSVKPGNTSPILTDQPVVTAISPNNTGLPVNVPIIVQSTHQISSGSVASINVAFASNTVKGNTLEVDFCNGNNNKAAAPITDTLSLTWNQAGSYSVSGTAFECAIFFAINNTGGANTITVTPGGTNASIAMEIRELSGLLTVAVAQPDNFALSNTTSSVTASPAVAYGPRTSNTYGIVAFGLGTAAQTITVCNTLGTATCPAGSLLTSDSGQLNPTTPAGLFSMVSASQFLEVPQLWAPAANAGVAEPWAVIAANFSPVEVSKQNVNWLPLQPSYRASASFAGSSTTDNACLPGNATNTVWLTRLEVSCTQTTAGIINFQAFKRSTADSGGTSANITVTPNDSRFAAGISIPLSYTGTGPSAGTSLGNPRQYRLGCLAPATAAPNDVWIANLNPPIALRGTGEEICINAGNAAITGGNLDVTFDYYELMNGITP